MRPNGPSGTLEALSLLGPMSVMRLRFLKLQALARCRDYWGPFIAERVLPTAEFESLPFLRDIRTVLDVGANRGQFAVFARHRFPGATVHMFEPVAASAEVAKRVAPTATVHRVALGARNGTTEFFVHPDSDQSSVFAVSHGVRCRQKLFQSSIRSLT